MSGYVIQREEDGHYVAPPGQMHSYTGRLQDARVFKTREDAERERCDNEHVLPLDYAFHADRR